jgi:hypothetical protein
MPLILFACLVLFLAATVKNFWIGLTLAMLLCIAGIVVCTII